MVGSQLSQQLILTLLPDETLYSFASRFHFLSGSPTPARTGRLLFGNPRAGVNHDFTGNIDYVARQLQLPDSRLAALRHTVLPIYFPFYSQLHCENWIARLLAGSPSSMKAELGLLASRFEASHPLKACAHCAESDTTCCGTSYWHVEHQLPGVSACRIHQLPLMHTSYKISGQDRFAWLMPNDAQLHPSAVSHVSEVALSFADVATRLWNLPIDFEFDQHILRRTYIDAADKVGLWDARRQKYDLSAFRLAISEVVERSGIAAYEPWLSNNRGGELLVPRFVRMLQTAEPRQTRHPLNHIILILALFNDWPSFWAAYKCTSAHPFYDIGTLIEDKSHGSERPTTDPARVNFITMVRSGRSATAAAQLAGVSTATAIAWLAQNGIAVKPKPKILLPELRKQAFLKLQRGQAKEHVAKSVGVSIQTITRLLFSEPGLHDSWQNARFSAAQAKARKEWSSAMQSCPDAASNEWRLLAPTAYAWLYRNDRVWLSDVIRNRSTPVRHRSTRVNWEMRDQRLEQSILEAVRASVDSDISRSSYTVVQLCTLVPLLRRHLGNLSLLPRTLRALSFVCRRRTTSNPKDLTLC